MEYLAVIAAMAVPFVLYGLFIFAGHMRKRQENRSSQAPVDDESTQLDEAQEAKQAARLDKLAQKEAKREAKEMARQAKLEARKARDEAKIARKSARSVKHSRNDKAYGRAEPSLGDDAVAEQHSDEPSFESADQVPVVRAQPGDQIDFAEIDPQPVLLPESEQEEQEQMAPPEVDAVVEEPEPQQQVASVEDETISVDEKTAPQPQDQHEQEDQSEEEEEPKPSDESDEEEKEDGFPSLDPDVLNEYYYYVVRMSVPTGMAGQTAMQMATELIQKTGLDRYQVLLGHNPAGGRWEKPRPDRDYSHLVWAVPLCSRESNISKDEMGSTVRVIQDRMRKSSGIASFPSHQDIEERLEEVDKFCDDVDHKMIVFLLAQKESGGQPQRNSDIIELAMHEKMEEVNGRIVRMVNGESWYVLDTGTGEALGKKSPDRRMANLMLWMDVPHVSNVEAAFNEMFDVARKLSRVLGFSLINEDQQTIDDDMIDNARVFISERCHYMLERGVRPGSKLARALFS